MKINLDAWTNNDNAYVIIPTVTLVTGSSEISLGIVWINIFLGITISWYKIPF
jgi:hypothetical protein